jgi:DNA polymerase delta subunit 1
LSRAWPLPLPPPQVFSQLLRKARDRGFLIPNIKPSGAPPADGVGYEGATVLDPKIGARWGW